MEEKKDMQTGQSIIQRLQQDASFQVEPCRTPVDLGDKNRFEPLTLSSEQKIHLSALMANVPSAAAAAAMSGAYTVTFPQGLPHTLLSLKAGGVGSQIIDETGRIVGSASIHQMAGQAACFGIFTAMSVATGQFFLTQINRELRMINQKLDDILKFLYGEKKAELLAEVSFVKGAADRYPYIMAHEAQRAATIVSLQDAGKIAIKDIEFYLRDLDSKISSGKKTDFSRLKNLMDNGMKQARDNLDLALDLYIMAAILETYYAQDFDKGYLDSLEDSITAYTKGIHDRMLMSYGVFLGYLNNYRPRKNEEKDLRKRSDTITKCREALDVRYKEHCRRIHTALYAATQKSEYYVTESGDVYFKRPVELENHV